MLTWTARSSGSASRGTSNWVRHDQVAAGLISLARNLSISPAIRHPTGEAVAFHRMVSRYRAGAPKSMPFISASTASSSLPTMSWNGRSSASNRTKASRAWDREKRLRRQRPVLLERELPPLAPPPMQGDCHECHKALRPAERGRDLTRISRAIADDLLKTLRVAMRRRGIRQP